MPDGENASGNPTTQILFLAFASSHLAFAGLGVFMGQQAEPANDLTLAYILGAVALSMTGMALFGAAQILGRGTDYFVYTILRFALAESVSIFGLVLALLGVPVIVVAPFWAVGLATHLAVYPSARDRELHASLQGR